MFCRSLFVLFLLTIVLSVLSLLTIVLSVLRRFTDSDYLFGIFKIFLRNKKKCIPNEFINPLNIRYNIDVTKYHRDLCVFDFNNALQ